MEGYVSERSSTRTGWRDRQQVSGRSHAHAEKTQDQPKTPHARINPRRATRASGLGPLRLRAVATCPAAQRAETSEAAKVKAVRRELTWFGLRFPQGLTEDAVLAVLSALSGVSVHTRLVFDLHANQQGIEHRLGVSSNAASI